MQRTETCCDFLLPNFLQVVCWAFRSRAIADLRTSLSEFLADFCSDSQCSSSLLWRTGDVWFDLMQRNLSVLIVMEQHLQWAMGTSHAHETKVSRRWASVSAACEFSSQRSRDPLRRRVPRKMNCMGQLVRICVSPSLLPVCAHSPVWREAWGGSQGCNYHSVLCSAVPGCSRGCGPGDVINGCKRLNLVQHMGGNFR